CSGAGDEGPEPRCDAGPGTTRAPRIPVRAAARNRGLPLDTPARARGHGGLLWSVRERGAAPVLAVSGARARTRAAARRRFADLGARRAMDRSIPRFAHVRRHRSSRARIAHPRVRRGLLLALARTRAAVYAIATHGAAEGRPYRRALRVQHPPAPRDAADAHPRRILPLQHRRPRRRARAA